MIKNRKVKICGFLVCIVMIVSSVATHAGYSSAEFGTSEGRATAQLECYNGRAMARTVPAWNGLSVSTRVACIKESESDSDDDVVLINQYTYSSSWVVASSDECTKAESRHTVGTSTYYLTCGNN